MARRLSPASRSSIASRCFSVGASAVMALSSETLTPPKKRGLAELATALVVVPRRGSRSGSGRPAPASARAGAPVEARRWAMWQSGDPRPLRDRWHALALPPTSKAPTPEPCPLAAGLEMVELARPVSSDDVLRRHGCKISPAQLRATVGRAGLWLPTEQFVESALVQSRPYLGGRHGLDLGAGELLDSSRLGRVLTHGPPRRGCGRPCRPSTRARPRPRWLCRRRRLPPGRLPPEEPPPPRRD